MANPEHLKILKQGVEVWNAWREEHPDIRPDLSGADLSGADLIGAKLTGANLKETKLSGAVLWGIDLRGAYLREADLTGADLSGGNLSGAHLRGAHLNGADLRLAYLRLANLSEADLTGANLTGADLSGAHLRGVHLRGANLKSAVLYETVFGNTYLRETEGLDACLHLGPSIIAMQTLRKSWPLPLSFLRGCGLDETFIEYLPSLIGQPIQFYSCFISYSSQDQVFASRLHNDLQAAGVRCWFAPEKMKIGSKIRYAIDQAIHLQDQLLLILSKHSVQSPWVEQEVETALEKERQEHRTVLLPIRIDQAVMNERAGWAAHLRRTRHIGDFSQWTEPALYREAFEHLLRDLQTGA